NSAPWKPNSPDSKTASNAKPTSFRFSWTRLSTKARPLLTRPSPGFIIGDDARGEGTAQARAETHRSHRPRRPDPVPAELHFPKLLENATGSAGAGVPDVHRAGHLLHLPARRRRIRRQRTDSCTRRPGVESGERLRNRHRRADFRHEFQGLLPSNSRTCAVLLAAGKRSPERQSKPRRLAGGGEPQCKIPSPVAVAGSHKARPQPRGAAPRFSAGGRGSVDRDG